MLDPAARRLVIASALRLHVARRLGTGPTGEGLLAAARRLVGTDEVERRYGLTFEPAFPGVSAGVETSAVGPPGSSGADRSRLVLACRVSRPAGTGEDEPVVVVTTLATGRPPMVTAAPPGTVVPQWWSASWP